MLTLLRYHIRILAPTLLWTGVLVLALIGLVLFHHIRHPEAFDAEAAGSLAEQLVPLIAAFFAAGALDPEVRRGVHEVVRARRAPFWVTVAWRLAAAHVLAFLLGAGTLAALHYGLRKPLPPLLPAAALPSALFLSVLALWTRIRLGHVFMGYMTAVGFWMADAITGGIEAGLGIAVNPLFTLDSYTDRLRAARAGALAATPYVDWWWASKIALLLAAAFLFRGIVRRIEHQVEAD